MLQFDCKTINGDPIVIKTEASDTFAARLTDVRSTPEQRAEAALALQWLADCVARTSALPALDQAAWRMVFELELRSVLDGWSQIITTVKNGVTHRSIEPVDIIPRTKPTQAKIDQSGMATTSI